MNTHAGFLRDPATRLGVQVGQIPEVACGQEVTLHVFNAGLDDTLFRWIRRRARIDLELISLGALRVCPLHHRVADTGARDRALWVVDDEPARHPAEPLERATVQSEPSGHRLVEHELDVLVA